jgi:hypothetical protein
LSDTGVLTVPELSTTSITSTGNNPIIIAPDGTGDVHLNADSVRIGDNNTDATLITRGTGDLLLTTNEGSATEGIIRIYDGANGNITLTPNGTGQVQVGSDQVVTLTASQTLTNKTLSSNSVWNGNVIGSAYGGAGTVNGILKANGSGTVSAASAGTDYVTSVSVTSPVSNTGTTANPTIALASGYGDTQNPYGSKTANYFLASPNGSAGVPTFRAIVAADIPTLNQNTTGTAANITATSNTTLTTLSSLVSIGTITTGTWNASAIGVAYGGTGLTSLTAGYIPYGSGTSAFGSSANLFWDSTNSRLGVGTSSPVSALDISDGTRHTYIQSRGSAAGTGLSIGTDVASYANVLNLAGDISGGASSGGVNVSYYSSNTGSWNAAASIRNTTSAYGNLLLMQDGGNVGIGVTPRAKLETSGSIFATSRSIPTGGAGPEIWWSGTVSGISSYDRTNSAYKPLLLEAEYSYFTTANGSEQMRINNTGVGIGTSNPLARLDIVGDATPNGNGLAFGHANTAGYKWIQSFASQPLYINPLGNNVIFNRDGGSVGIGTVSPASKLNVSGGNVTVSAGYGIAYSADQNRIMTPEDNVSGALIAWASGGICRFLTASTERMRITSGGDVGIGRTPSYTLDLAGDARFKRNSGSGWVFQTPSSDMRIVGETSGAHLCFIPSSANVGIDTTSPSEKLNVIGKIKASDVLLGNNGTKGYGAITTTTSTSTPTGGSSGDHYYIY